MPVREFARGAAGLIPADAFFLVTKLCLVMPVPEALLPERHRVDALEELEAERV
jgi:hypothetical protein